jgi:hypothetical protein
VGQYQDDGMGFALTDLVWFLLVNVWNEWLVLTLEMHTHSAGPLLPPLF